MRDYYSGFFRPEYIPNRFILFQMVTRVTPRILAASD
jgi:hypothetical protein